MLFSNKKTYFTRTIASIFAPLFLLSCTFSELYTPEVNEEMTHVFVSTLPDREGQLLRNRLRFLLEGHGKTADPWYNLDIKFTIVDSDQVMSQRGLARRRKKKIMATFSLMDRNTREILYKGKTQAENSYIVQTRLFYATTVTEDYVTRQTLHLIAQLIHAELALYFQKYEN